MWSDKLTFGQGTVLKVYPKSREIKSLSILMPSNVGQPEVCVAHGGIQSTYNMTLALNDGTEKLLEITKGAMYVSKEDNFFAGFHKDIKTCKMEEHTVSGTETKEDDEPSVTPGTPTFCEEDSGNDMVTNNDINGRAKVRFRVLTVNSIRVLLAKAVAFDILVTMKAMLF